MTDHPTSFLIDNLRRTSNGDPWYGSSIADVLGTVTARQAAMRPIASAHSIWELVLHLTAWVREVDRRLKTGKALAPQEGDWPVVPVASDENWARAVADLGQAHEDLASTLETFPSARLGETVGDERDPALGTGVTYQTTLQGLLQHDAYHLGQISLLKKLV